MPAQSEKHDQGIHRPAQVAPERIAPDQPAQDARQGKKLGVMRWVLSISLALVIAGFLASYLLTT